MEADLVCEGRCNPSLRQLDAAVAAFRRSPDGEPTAQDGINGRPAVDEDGRQWLVYPSPPAYLVTALRAVQHTTHRVRHRFLAICTICGHERRWGN